MQYSELDQICNDYGLISFDERSAVFQHTPHTFRNYQKKYGAQGDFLMRPYWDLIVEAFTDIVDRDPEVTPHFRRMDVAWFDAWCRARGLKNNSSIAEAFGVSRQAVWNWYHRKDPETGAPAFPDWLEMACYGYDVLKGIGVDSNRRLAGDKYTPRPTLEKEAALA